jgi:hypothetical protein
LHDLATSHPSDSCLAQNRAHKTQRCLLKTHAFMHGPADTVCTHQHRHGNHVHFSQSPMVIRER